MDIPEPCPFLRKLRHLAPGTSKMAYLTATKTPSNELPKPYSWNPFLKTHAVIIIMILLNISAIPGVLAAVPGCVGSMAEADASACLMKGARDSTCCAVIGEGSCTSGFAYEQGEQKCGGSGKNGNYKSTCCLASAGAGLIYPSHDCNIFISTP